MFITGVKKPRNISAKLDPKGMESCKDYIKGAVYGFCNNHSGERFSIRTLFGGENTLWEDVPLEKIYDYHYDKKSHDCVKAHKQAGVDVGLLLQLVLFEDSEFEYDMFEGRPREYCRVTVE